MKLVAWTIGRDQGWVPHYVAPNSYTTHCGLPINHRCRHDVRHVEVTCPGCQGDNMKIKFVCRDHQGQQLQGEPSLVEMNGQWEIDTADMTCANEEHDIEDTAQDIIIVVKGEFECH